jgi:hypothetical protein
MPYKITIPITDGECATSYAIEIKRTSDTLYQPLDNQLSLPIVIDGLEDYQDYDVRITRRCCNGINSAPITISVTGMVPMPSNFQLSDMGGGSVYMEWSPVDGAEEYTVIRDTDPSFSSPVVIYNGALTSHTDTVLSSGIYYFAVKASTTGKVDSDYLVKSIKIEL